jgi:hypothetical protein
MVIVQTPNKRVCHKDANEFTGTTCGALIIQHRTRVRQSIFTFRPDIVRSVHAYAPGEWKTVWVEDEKF